MKPAFVTAPVFCQSRNPGKHLLFFFSLKVFFVSRLSVGSKTLAGALEEEQLGNLN